MSDAVKPLLGLHHVTAIAGDAQRNLDFYVKGLGLRFVKRTVNFDDPSAYHLYYGDEVGSPGTALTFFPFPGAQPGRIGSGEVALTQFSVPAGALDFWAARLPAHGATVLARETVFDEERLIAVDPDGLPIALVVPAQEDARAPWSTEEIDETVAVRGFHGATLALRETESTAAILTELFGYQEVGTTAFAGGQLTRFAAEGPAGVIDLHAMPDLGRGEPGYGTVHHIAFRTPNRETQAALRERIQAAGHQVTPSIDRDYFHAIYFRTPGGVLFEVATDEPGFERDEPRESLGRSLKLPSRYEPHRAAIESRLPPLTL
ncbi:MAG: ring-cleaving dioxygenase [Pseudomonadota bacterium]